MAEKIKCPNCGNMTYAQTHCIHCGAALRGSEGGRDARCVQAETDISQAQGGFEEHYRAVRASLCLEEKKFLRFLAFKHPKVAVPQWLPRLNVPRGWKATIYSQTGKVERELEQGVYSAAKIGGEVSPLAAVVHSARGSHLSIFLYQVAEFPISFMVPEKDPPYHTLAGCGIRCAEGFSGGALVNMVLRIQDPAHLLFALRNLDSGAKPASLSQVLLAPFAFMDTLFAPPAGTADADTLIAEFAADSLWNRLRGEFVHDIGLLMRNESALEMRDSPQVQNRILEGLSKAMTAALQRYGVELREVTSFQFLSPDHDSILCQQVVAAQVAAQMRSEKPAAELRKEERDVTEMDLVDAAEASRGIERARIEAAEEIARRRLAEEETTNLRKAAADGAVSEIVDRNKAASSARALRLRAAEEQHEREQEQARTRLLVGKAKMMLEVKKQAMELENQAEEAKLQRHNKALAAQHERRLSFLRAIAEVGLPPDSILALQLSDRPELAAAYAEAVRARSYEDRIQLQREFEDKLIRINTSEREQVNTLLRAGIEQIGRVMVEAQRKQRPTVVAAGNAVYEVSGDSPRPSPKKLPERPADNPS